LGLLGKKTGIIFTFAGEIGIIMKESGVLNMNEFRTIELKKGIYERNNVIAQETREDLTKKNTSLLNLMSSPGAGKTTFIVETIKALRDEMSIAVMEADVDSDVDAATIAQTGTKVIQLHTGGMCHLDAEMTRQGLESLDAQNVDMIVLENIGNLLCTAGYDTGAHINVMILSVPEGDDKPLKYPPMFRAADVLIISKVDALTIFDFNMDACISRAKSLNPNIEIFPVSAKTGEGMNLWLTWLRRNVGHK